jgi:hypothetical protein
MWRWQGQRHSRRIPPRVLTSPPGSGHGARQDAHYSCDNRPLLSSEPASKGRVRLGTSDTMVNDGDPATIRKPSGLISGLSGGDAHRARPQGNGHACRTPDTLLCRTALVAARPTSEARSEVRRGANQSHPCRSL